MIKTTQLSPVVRATDTTLTVIAKLTALIKPHYPALSVFQLPPSRLALAKFKGRFMRSVDYDAMDWLMTYNGLTLEAEQLLSFYCNDVEAVRLFSLDQVTHHTIAFTQILSSCKTTDAAKFFIQPPLVLGESEDYWLVLEAVGSGGRLVYVNKEDHTYTTTDYGFTDWVKHCLQIELRQEEHEESTVSALVTPQAFFDISLESVGLEAAGDPVIFKNIKAVYDEHCDITMDRKWLKTLLMFNAGYEMRTDDHINFLGGNLVGVYRLHWKAEDTNQWLLDVAGITNRSGLKQDYHNLESIDPSFMVIGNPINASFVYLAHRVMVSSLSAGEKERALEAIFSTMHYHFISSLMYHQFPFRAQESIALSLYENLSRKSLLKQHQNWGNLIKARAADIVATNGIHYNTIKSFTDDAKITYVISDVQSRIREVIKRLKDEYLKLKDEDARVISQSALVNDSESDVKILREYVSRNSALVKQMTDIAKDPLDLIREAVMENTLNLVPTTSERHLTDVLETLSSTLSKRNRHQEKAEELVKRLVLFILNYIANNNDRENNTVYLVVKVRNLMRSSQLTNEDALAVRNLTSEIVELAMGKRSQAAQASARIGTLVYLTLRLLTLDHYR